MKKRIVLRLIIVMLFFSLFLIMYISLARALITLETSPEKTYRLGQKIDVDLSITQIQETEVIVSSEISCNNKLNYFRTPLDLTANSFVNIPSLTVNKNFLGTCKIIFSVLDQNEKVLETYTTEDIETTNILPFNFSTDKEVYSPGEKIVINGRLEKGVKLQVLIKDKDNEIGSINEILTNDFFSVVFELVDELSNGEKNIFISAEDKYGNTAIGTKKIGVLQVPRSLNLELEKSEIMPYEILNINSHVYDQSNQEMILELDYKITAPDERAIETITSNSNKQVSLDLDNPLPGEYIIIASYKELDDIEKFIVLEFKEIEIKIEGGVISVVNIGNVEYKDNLVVNASVEGITYQIPISLNLKVNEKTFIDIRTELPSENYDVTASSKDKTYQIGNLKIDDNRPLIKKMSQGLSIVTGSTIIQTDKVGNVFYIGFFLVLLGFLVTFFVYRRFKTEIVGVVDTTVKVQGRQIGGLKNSLTKQQKEKNKIKNLFSSYVDPNILKNNFTPKITKKKITVLFTDIRGFAKLFDSKDSGKITNMLNMYFSKSSYIIKKNNGFINKFIGDSVMALFNAVNDDENHLINSINSAIELKKEINILNEKLKPRGFEPIKVGIGIDSGECSVGAIGSKEKLEFTAIGVPVNTAFRLQSISDGQILITESIYQKIKDEIRADYYGSYEMKNISGNVRVYRVLGVG